MITDHEIACIRVELLKVSQVEGIECRLESHPMLGLRVVLKKKGKEITREIARVKDVAESWNVALYLATEIAAALEALDALL